MTKKKYSAVVTIDANVVVYFEAEEGLTEEQLKDLAMEHADMPSVCHHCARKLEIGDWLECTEVIEL